MAYSLYSLSTGVYSYDIGQFTLSLLMAFHFNFNLIILEIQIITILTRTRKTNGIPLVKLNKETVAGHECMVQLL
jgi:hypothetical protein